MGMIYQWKPGSHVALDAQSVGDELERIRVHQNGRIESEDVVREARDDASPLHPAFDWNDATAAEKYRVEQAKYLIRSIEVVIERSDEEPVPIRAFVSVKRDEDRSYTSTVHALSDPVLRAQIVEQAFKELEAWRQRHAELTEFARFFSVIDARDFA
jgi:hypothetical protein